MSKSQATTLSPELVAAILPFATVIVEGSGKLWNAARDSFVLANAELKDAKEAAKAVRYVIRNELKANDGSAKAYMSTLVWLCENGHAVAELTKMQADDLRYPKAVKIAADDIEGQVEQARKRATKAAEKIAKAAAEAAAEANPNKGILQSIAEMLSGLDAAQLEIVALTILETIEGFQAEQEYEQDGAIAA